MPEVSDCALLLLWSMEREGVDVFFSMVGVEETGSVYFQGVQIDQCRAVGSDNEIDMFEIAMGDAVVFQPGQNHKDLVDDFCFLGLCNLGIGQIVMQLRPRGQFCNQPGAFEQPPGVFLDKGDR